MFQVKFNDAVITLLLSFTIVYGLEEGLLHCVVDNQGNVNVSYNGSLMHKSFLADSTNLTTPFSGNQTIHNLTVCLYNNYTAVSLNSTYDISCMDDSQNISTLDVRNGNVSEAYVCFNSRSSEKQSNTSSLSFDEVTDPPALSTFDPRRPMATLAVIDSDGYMVNNVKSTEELRLRVQTLTNEKYFPPIIGQCWYRLSEGNQNNKTIVQPNVMFVEYGCSVQGENQLISTNQDLFYINGLMEKVSYPFDLAKFYHTHMFDFMQITCEVYYCNKAQHCRARCPPSQTTYQVSGHPKRLNLTTEIYVVLVEPTTKKVTTKLPIQRKPVTTPLPKEEKSVLEEYQSYFVIGTLIATALCLCLIIGLLVKFILGRNKDGKGEDNYQDPDVIFHTNVPPEEHCMIATKEKHKLLDQNHNIDTRQDLHNHGKTKIVGNPQLDPRHTGHNSHTGEVLGFHGNTRIQEHVNLDPRQGHLDPRQTRHHQGDQRIVDDSHQDVRHVSGFHSNQMLHANGYIQGDPVVKHNQRHSRNIVNSSQMSQNQWNLSQIDQNQRLTNGCRGDWIPRPHSNQYPNDLHQSERHAVQISSTNQARNMTGGNLAMSSPPPAYISKTNLRSTPRSQGMVNYGFERSTPQSHQHGNSRMESRATPDLPALHNDPHSPVGGELYPWEDFERDHIAETSVKEQRNLRPHRSDTALLNNALREYFHRHGMLKK